MRWTVFETGGQQWGKDFKMIDARRIRGLTAVVFGAGLTATAQAAPLSANPIAVAVRHGECHTAVDLVIRGAAANDAPAVYLGGRMLDAGICVKQDGAAAAKFFARAGDLGDPDSSLQYAAKVGLGEGFEQSYQHAGEICRAAGLDPQARLSDYSLGYACTVSGVASGLLRESLPAGAFRPDSGPLLVEFNPASPEVSIRQTPEVEIAHEPLTGSHIRRARVNPHRAIQDAWLSAVATVPKPDPGRLDKQVVKLSLDVDMALDRRQMEGTADPDHTLRPLVPENLGPVMIPLIPHK